MAVKIAISARVAHGHEAINAEANHDVHAGGNKSVAHRNLQGESGRVTMVGR